MNVAPKMGMNASEGRYSEQADGAGVVWLGDRRDDEEPELALALLDEEQAELDLAVSRLEVLFTHGEIINDFQDAELEYVEGLIEEHERETEERLKREYNEQGWVRCPYCRQANLKYDPVSPHKFCITCVGDPGYNIRRCRFEEEDKRVVREVVSVSKDTCAAIMRTAGGHFFHYKTGEAWKWRALLLEAITYSTKVRQAVFHMAGPEYIQDLYRCVPERNNQSLHERRELKKCQSGAARGKHHS